MINIAIVGYGYWGKNLVRNFNLLENCRVAMVIESDEVRRKNCLKLYPNIPVSASIDDALNHADIQAVVIATPVDSHYALSKKALQAGKHVLVEKPLTGDAASAKELVELARQKGLTLMVDHTFLYTGAVMYLKKLVDSGALGNIYYIDSTRINLGLFQHDVNVLWDLAPHDISICNYLIGKKPISVQATGISHTFNNIENIAYLTLKFEDHTIAHFNCSWISPVKVRMMLIGGDKKMAVFNDMEPTEKVKVYDTGFDVKNDEEMNRIVADYRVGDIHVPKLSGHEALGAMAKDFIASLSNNSKPISSAELGLTVVEILDAAQRSIRENGKEMPL
jgi:predicted dehydrogenase